MANPRNVMHDSPAMVKAWRAVSDAEMAYFRVSTKPGDFHTTHQWMAACEAAATKIKQARATYDAARRAALAASMEQLGDVVDGSAT